MKVNSELKNWTIQVVNTLPSNPPANTIVMLASDKRIYFYDGITWGKLLTDLEIRDQLLPLPTLQNAGKIVKLTDVQSWTFVGIGGEIIENIPLSFVPRSFSSYFFNNFVSDGLSHDGVLQVGSNTNTWKIYGDTHNLRQYIENGVILSISSRPGEDTEGTIVGTVTSDITVSSNEDGFSGDVYSFTMTSEYEGRIASGVECNIVVSAPWLLPEDSITPLEIKTSDGTLSSNNKVLGIKGISFLTDTAKRLMTNPARALAEQGLKKTSDTDYDVEWGDILASVTGTELNTTEGDLINILGIETSGAEVIHEPFVRVSTITTRLSGFLSKDKAAYDSVYDGNDAAKQRTTFLTPVTIKEKIDALKAELLPRPVLADANKYPTVKSDGTGFVNLPSKEPLLQPTRKIFYASMDIAINPRTVGRIVWVSFDDGRNWKQRPIFSSTNFNVSMDVVGDYVVFAGDNINQYRTNRELNFFGLSSLASLMTTVSPPNVSGETYAFSRKLTTIYNSNNYFLSYGMRRGATFLSRLILSTNFNYSSSSIAPPHVLSADGSLCMIGAIDTNTFYVSIARGGSINIPGVPAGVRPVYKTINGGATWTRDSNLETLVNLDFRAVRMVKMLSLNEWYMLASGNQSTYIPFAIYKSTDQGATWQLFQKCFFDGWAKLYGNNITRNYFHSFSVIEVPTRP